MCLVEAYFIALTLDSSSTKCLYSKLVLSLPPWTRLRLNVFSRNLFCRYPPFFNREVLVRCYFGPLFRLGFPKLRCARLVPRLVKSIRSVLFWTLNSVLGSELRCALLVPRLVKSIRSVLFWALVSS